ncbi:MAG TPA: rod shape-determining protein MreD [Burkholderiales bacterium]|jgi:rod shape-determining protein MreD|nr:rod shape-determining protein MreD [Burkholderiales bacterium]
MRIGGFGHISSEEILLPVRPAYIALTLLGALMLNLLPLTGWVLAVRPDFVALALLYWGIHQPRKIGFFPAWLLGLAMDVADGSLFGQHALAYSAMMFAAIFLHRRVSMFDLRHQMLHVLVILLAMQLIVLGVREAAGGELPGWWYFLSSATGALLWPVTHVVFTAPLRPRHDPDDV